MLEKGKRGASLTGAILTGAILTGAIFPGIRQFLNTGNRQYSCRTQYKNTGDKYNVAAILVSCIFTQNRCKTDVSGFSGP
jgi:uncharacterized protein YjbI with pentapeptide repeats